MVHFGDGRLLLTARSNLGWVFASNSTDNGTTWVPARRLDVRQSSSPTHMDVISSTGSVVMLYYPRYPVKDDGDRRQCVGSLLSRDEGRTWSNYREIEYEREQPRAYQNVSLRFIGDTAHIFYSYATSPDGWGDGCYLRLPAQFFTADGP